MQALEIQGIKMQALLIAMHLFFRFVEFSMLYVSKNIVIILLPYKYVCMCVYVCMCKYVWGAAINIGARPFWGWGVFVLVISNINIGFQKSLTPPLKKEMKIKEMQNKRKNII